MPKIQTITSSWPEFSTDGVLRLAKAHDHGTEKKRIIGQQLGTRPIGLKIVPQQ